MTNSNTSPPDAPASPADALDPLLTSGTTDAGAGTSGGEVIILSVEWSRSQQRDVAIVAVADRRYELPLAEDAHCPTGHGGGSAPVWWVDDRLTTEEADEAIGSRYDVISELVTEYMLDQRSAA